MNEKKQKKVFITLCLLPATLLVLIFMVYPTINVFFMSLFKWGGYSAEKTFVGLDNFKTLIKDMAFFRSFQNTILLIVIVTIFTLALALIFASILTREKFKGVNLFRIIFYIPNILSIVVIAAIFSAIYDPSSGLLNNLLSAVRLENLQQLWLGNQKIVIYSIGAALIWQAIGYYMVMYMASMASIPESLYEASALEGASAIQQFFTITLPLTWSTIRTTLTFFVISTINLSFLLVKAMTNGGPDGSTEVFLSYMYKQAYTNSSYGYGMAIGVVVFTFSFILSAVLNKITKRDVYEF
ncbi:sugar ABC transporter permease [Enterococcus sp. MJM12]|uniref:Sugar ABC transporter permease n=1 Tax=Candidatus Enterococcus myersii TaxID=2815322 RepID=A0ABS3H8M7_9ENTE|nr:MULTISPECIES: sugar ABC transporter permease [Enterococcus]MBO0449795.1 sugar ABC transporter permease [Enterococcus sp. MJM12]MCD1023748.1 sugar ABC transporter permease [Enterococcus sp. SMC-9]MDT2738423.1 sugar ABC transporter permease [Enterococcus canintestini]WHA08491.1 sugar ABC transporter permease [Enterococcus montenegrensis]